jgi:hypothetical protein
MVMVTDCDILASWLSVDPLRQIDRGAARGA